MLGLSDIASRIVQSTIRTMSVECDRVGGINLAQGVCDTEVPTAVRHGAEAAIEAGFNQYTRLDGIARLRNAIAQKSRRFYGQEVDPDRHVTVTCGVTEAVIAALPGADSSVRFRSGLTLPISSRFLCVRWSI